MRRCARARAGQWVPCAPASPTAAATPCGRACASTTRCTATARHRGAAAALVDRPLADLEAAGARTWPGTPGRGVRRPGQRALGPAGRARRRTTTPSWSPTRSPSWTRSGFDDAVVVGLLAREPGCCSPWRPTTRTGSRGAVFVGGGGRAARPAEPGRDALRGGAGELRGLGAVERAPLAPGPGRVRGVLLRRGVPGAALDPAGRGGGRRGRWRPTPRRWWRRGRRSGGCWAPPRRGPPPARVRCPALVLHGDDDRIAPLSDGVALARGTRLPDRRRGRGGGHCVQARHPVWFNLAAAPLRGGGGAPVRAREPDLAGEVDRDGVRDPLRGVRLRADRPCC